MFVVRALLLLFAIWYAAVAVLVVRRTSKSEPFTEAEGATRVASWTFAIALGASWPVLGAIGIYRIERRRRDLARWRAVLANVAATRRHIDTGLHASLIDVLDARRRAAEEHLRAYEAATAPDGSLRAAAAIVVAGYRGEVDRVLKLIADRRADASLARGASA